MKQILCVALMTRVASMMLTATWKTGGGPKIPGERAMNIINQYNGYIAVDTFHLNGELREGENIADNGGLSIAYAAFKKTPQGKGNEKIEGVTRRCGG
jgi:predicted metalloendopeptidase